MGNISKTTKFFAAMLVLGGAFGIAVGIWLAVQALSQSWLYIFMVVPFIGLFVWSLYTGIRLWRGDSYGRKWAPILFASQIPIIATPGPTVNWFTEAQLGPALKFAGEAFEATLSVNFGASGQFFLASGSDQTILGINLFAAIALFCLVRSNNSFKPKPLRGSA